MSTLQNSFVANVNLLVKHLPDILELNSNLTQEGINALYKLSKIDITEIIKDFEKETFEGNRKLDINLFKSYKEYSEELSTEELELIYSDETKAPKYSGLTLYTSLNELKLDFTIDGLPVNITTNQELYEQLVNSAEVMEFVENTGIGSFPVEIVDNLVRFYDNARWSNIKAVKLHITGPSSLSNGIDTFTWSNSTSVLEFLVNYIEEFIKVYESVPQLLLIHKEINESITEFTKLSKEYSELLKKYKEDSEYYWTKLQNATATAESVPFEEEASVSYDEGKFHFKIPRAEDGILPLGISVQKFVIDEKGHLIFNVINNSEADSVDAFINERGELILELQGGNS